jgi:DNA-binding MarR family transcriptional regulator
VTGSETAATERTGDSELDAVDRIIRAWRELRRGAAAQTLRARLLGTEGVELEQAQLDALEILASEPDGMRMSTFADALRVDPSTATRALDRLERLGLAERSATDPDRRVVVAHPTEQGRRLLTRISRRRRAGVEQLLDTFDDRDRELLAEQLDRFVASIDRVVDDLSTGT